MRSVSRLLARASSSASAFERLPASATARSYSGPNLLARAALFRFLIAAQTTSARTTSTPTTTRATMYCCCIAVSLHGSMAETARHVPGPGADEPQVRSVHRTPLLVLRTALGVPWMLVALSKVLPWLRVGISSTDGHPADRAGRAVDGGRGRAAPPPGLPRARAGRAVSV